MMNDDEIHFSLSLSLTHALSLNRFDLAAVRAPIDICSCFHLNRHRNSSTVYGSAIVCGNIRTRFVQLNHIHLLCRSQAPREIQKAFRIFCSILLIDSVRTIVTCPHSTAREMISKCFSIQFSKGTHFVRRNGSRCRNSNVYFLRLLFVFNKTNKWMDDISRLIPFAARQQVYSGICECDKLLILWNKRISLMQVHSHKRASAHVIPTFHISYVQSMMSNPVRWNDIRHLVRTWYEIV